MRHVFFSFFLSFFLSFFSFFLSFFLSFFSFFLSFFLSFFERGLAPASFFLSVSFRQELLEEPNKIYFACCFLKNILNLMSLIFWFVFFSSLFLFFSFSFSFFFSFFFFSSLLTPSLQYGYRNIATSQEFFDYLSDRFFNAHVDTEVNLLL